MIKTGWIDRAGVFYETENDKHAEKARDIYSGAQSDIEAEKHLELTGWVRVRHGVPFYGSLLSPTEAQKNIIMEGYFNDINHYRELCRKNKGVVFLFSLFLENEKDITKLERGEL